MRTAVVAVAVVGRDIDSGPTLFGEDGALAEFACASIAAAVSVHAAVREAVAIGVVAMDASRVAVVVGAAAVISRASGEAIVAALVVFVAYFLQS